MGRTWNCAPMLLSLTAVEVLLLLVHQALDYS